MADPASLYSTYADAVTRIMQANAASQAEAIRQRGQIWGNAITNIGQSIAAIPQQIQQQQLGKLKIAEAQGQVDEITQRRNDMQALDNAFAQPGGRDAILNAIPGHLRPTIQKSFIEGDKAAAEANSAAYKLQQESQNYLDTAMEEVKAHRYDPLAAQLAISHAKMQPFIKSNPAAMDSVSRLEQAIQQTPTAQGVQALVDPYIQGIQARKSSKDKLEEAQAAHAGQETVNAAAQLPGLQANAAVQQQVAAGTVGGLTPEQQAQQANQAALAGFREREVAATEQKVPGEIAHTAAETSLARTNAAKAGLEADQLKGMTGSAGAQVPDVGAGQRNDDFLKTLAPPLASQVKALAEGRMQFPSGFALKSPYWQGMLSAVAKYDPSFDAVNYNARAKTRNDFTSGKAAQQVNALNTVVGHLSELSDKADQLGNTPIQFVNSVKNWVKTQGGGSAVTNFDTAKQAVADELTRVYRQAGGTESDVKNWQQSLGAANSPAQLKGAFSTIADLLESKLQALQGQYEQGMGTSDVQMVTPKARAALEKLKGQTPGTEAPTTRPTAQTAPTVGSTVTFQGKRYKVTGISGGKAQLEAVP